MVHTFRPPFGRPLTIVVGSLCAIGLVTTATEGADALGDYGPWLVLAAVSCWALFWRPAVEVSDAGVRLVNVTRTIDVPWPAITGVETRWALTLQTAYGRLSAWAAPAPGRRAARKATLEDFRAAPRDPGVDAVRVGDLEASPSGDAAALVRARWVALRAAGHLDNPRLEHERVPVTWHWGTIAAVVTLVAVGVVGIVT